MIKFFKEFGFTAKKIKGKTEKAIIKPPVVPSIAVAPPVNPLKKGNPKIPPSKYVQTEINATLKLKCPQIKNKTKI